MVSADEEEQCAQLLDHKLEGQSILNQNEVAIINDNDFGVVVPNAPTNMGVVRLARGLK